VIRHRPAARRLQELFPRHRVSQSIAETDGPDQVVLTVSDHAGKALFEIRSQARYSDRAAKRPRNTDALPIERVEVFSPAIPDFHGLRVGMRYRDILARRGGKLEFTVNHHDVSLGADGVYYNLAPPRPRDGPGPEPNRANLVRGNWPIASISVPGPRW
jgi:hypothetical protein